MSVELRPQPLGLFPLPASYLLLPPCAGATAVQQTLLQGRLPEVWPDELRFYALALAGDHAGALAALAGHESALAQYNRFVLQADPLHYAVLRREFCDELASLLDVVAYTLGYIDDPPAGGPLDGELLALVLLTQATHALETEDATGAIPLLEEAVAAAQAMSPIFAGQLLGALAETFHHSLGANAQVVAHYRRAIQLLAPTTLRLNRAELLINLGICQQELANSQRGLLMEAARCYQEALQTFTREQHPEPYALAHNNLALAYLSMPMTEASDQLRMGIAVQSLREALKIYSCTHNPEMWASVQLNLANALQYLPSSHPEENLIEAVQLYEDLLSVRDRMNDPVGYARLLANQGNALAHLGIYDHALPKLQEALTLFTAYAHHEEAAAIRNGLNEIIVKVAADGTVPTPAI